MLIVIKNYQLNMVFRNVPTLVKVNSNGEELDRLVGNQSLEQLKIWYNG